MTTPQPPAPPSRGPITTVATVGISLFRMGAAAVTLPIAVASTVIANLARLGDRIVSGVGSTGTTQSRSDLAGATNDLIGSTVGVYLGILKATVDSLSTAARIVDNAVAEATQPTRKQ